MVFDRYDLHPELLDRHHCYTCNEGNFREPHLLNSVLYPDDTRAPVYNYNVDVTGKIFQFILIFTMSTAAWSTLKSSCSAES